MDNCPNDSRRLRARTPHEWAAGTRPDNRTAPTGVRTRDRRPAAASSETDLGRKAIVPGRRDTRATGVPRGRTPCAAINPGHRFNLHRDVRRRDSVEVEVVAWAAAGSAAGRVASVVVAI